MDPRLASAARFAAAVLLAGLAASVAAAAAEAVEVPEVAAVRQAAQPLAGADGDYDGLLAAIGEARIVMLGEATHGSDEFHRERERIVRRLAAEKGFRAIVAEGDGPQFRRLGRYLRGEGGDGDAAAALAGIRRFPRWMWRNAAFADALDDLRAFNAGLPAGAQPVDAFGMDLYAVPEAAAAVVAYLQGVDPAAARLAKGRYRCFARFEREPQLYGWELRRRSIPSCRRRVERQLADMQRRLETAAASGRPDDALFNAWLDARLVKNGEAYYRALYGSNVSSWNLRERHMAETIELLLARWGEGAKAVVLAHNIHQGDARMTDQAAVGEVSLGQLMRERYGAENVFIVGFTTAGGTVRAASRWGGRDRVKQLRPALPESFTGLFHATGLPRFLLLFRGGDGALAELLGEPRPERAIGVNYLPGDERASHYFGVRLAKQFDAVIHIDATTAVAPLVPRPASSPPGR